MKKFLNFLLLIITVFFIDSCNRGSEDNIQDNNHRDGMGQMHEDGGMPGMHGMMRDTGRMMMMSEEEMERMEPEMMRDMRVIHGLLTNHEKVSRSVKNIPGGIESWTESDDTTIVAAIQEHVWQMKERMEEGRPIRMMDPLFRQLFDHNQQIDLNIENTEKGVHVIETSDDPKVTALIRQHAHRAVSEFVEHGMERARQPTPLPEGYDYN